MNGGMTVSIELSLRLVVPDHTTVPLLASLSYDGDDPYAVRMAFHVGLEEPVEWIFARDLLIAGTHQLTGDGDIQVWPADGTGSEVLNIALSSPFGQALFEAPAAAVADFLERTYKLVPEGREGDFIDIESEIEELLWQQ
jgi:Streptomyces sporulation and cell division protein, SsgA